MWEWMLGVSWRDMLVVGVPVLEKILRPILVGHLLRMSPLFNDGLTAHGAARTGP